MNMTHIGRLLLLFVAAAHPLLPAAAARADDAAEDRAPQRGWDYSRFSDGPRWVPRPRGASLSRAEALGLGTRRTASRLLASRPDARWVAAARGRTPGRLQFPVEGGRIGRGFGLTRRVRRDLPHDGVDIVAPAGSVVRAVADGIVAYSDNGIRGYGNSILIVHTGGWVSLYAHNQRNTVQAGWRVRGGERIGFLGSTGISRGPHLHFELRRDGRLVDPAPRFAPRAEGRLVGVQEAEAGTRAPASPPEPESGGEGEVHYRGLGTQRLTRRLLRRPPPAALLEQAGGRLFRNLLWPVRGGALASSGRDGAVIAAERGTPIRAAADGLVVFAGEGLGQDDRTVVLLHRSGWLTVYGSATRIAVEVGQRVERGQWIGRIGPAEGGAGSASALRFELWEAGRRREATPLFVGAPG